MNRPAEFIIMRINMKRIIILLALLYTLAGTAAAREKESRFNNPKGYFTMVGLKVPTIIYPIAGADVVAGWRFCPQFALGVGTGVWTAFVQNVEVPLYLHLRSDISDTRVSPYVALNAGYNFEARPAVEDLLEFGGVFASADIGVSYNVGKYRMTTGIEARFQRGRENVISSLGLDPGDNSRRFVPFLSLNVAIMF